MNDRGDDEEIGNLDHDDKYDDDIDPREDIYDLGESEDESEDEEEERDDDDDDDDDFSYDSINADGWPVIPPIINTVEKFIRTFHKGYYDAEFDDALKLDQNVIPRFSPTQESYNKPDNWIERNRIGLERVKEQLQNFIDLVSHEQSVDLMLTHNIYEGQLIDNEEPIVWHEPILDHNWDVLEAEIDQMRLLDRVTDICGIQITNVEMKKERLAALVAMLLSGRATNSSTCLDFDNANLCEEGIVSLSKLVDVSSELKYLYLGHNRINNMDSARCLSRSIKSHIQLNQLSLQHCDLGSSLEILSVVLQSDVRIIHLDYNNIESLGALKISEYLEDDPPIEELNLNHNRLNDDGVILIFQALKNNTNLQSIDMHSNNITSIGVKALLTCVFNSSSLNAISESNHTLERLVLFSRQTNVSSLVYRIARLLALDRTEKIVLALNVKESLLQYLANIPLKLIPEVLAFPCGRIVNEHEHKHLNIVYSTMRWWNMPLLYNNNYCVKSDTKRKRKMTV
jgi:hypothetical protein